MDPEAAPAVSPPGGWPAAPATAERAVPVPDGVAPPADPAGPAGPALSAREQEMLAFERHWWRQAGAKETAIRERFGLPPTRYYQVLNALVDRPAALAADPLLVRRLRRLRAARGQRRSSQNLGKGG